MNFEPDFESKLDSYCKAEGLGVVYYKDYNTMEDTNNINEAQYLSFVFASSITVKLPKKKLITIDWLNEKLNKSSEFLNLTKYLNKIAYQYSLVCYPASYGIGICNIFGKSAKSVERITTILDHNSIEYYNEYSDAAWVYRFKISKSIENINKLKQLTNH